MCVCVSPSLAVCLCLCLSAEGCLDDRFFFGLEPELYLYCVLSVVHAYIAITFVSMPIWMREKCVLFDGNNKKQKELSCVQQKFRNRGNVNETKTNQHFPKKKEI